VIGSETECCWVIVSLNLKLTDTSDGRGVTAMMGSPKTLSPSTYVVLGPTKSAPKVALPSDQNTDAVEGGLERDRAVR
jgi:hypothetical protein